MGCSNSSEADSANAQPQINKRAANNKSTALKPVPPHVQEKPKAERDLAKIKELLPTTKDEAGKAKRKEMFKEWDNSGTGKLSLAKIDLACREILHLDQYTNNLEPVLIRAYNSAKSFDHAVSDHDYIHFVEFRILLVYITNYFELMEEFEELGSDLDSRLDEQAFASHKDKLNAWGAKVTDTHKAFEEIVKPGERHIDFTEFVDWASKNKIFEDGYVDTE